MKKVEEIVTRGIGYIVLGLVILTVAVGGPALVLAIVAGGLSREALTAWAIAVTLALVPVFFVGFYFGKVEVRGYLSGVDTGLDRLAAAVNLRDSARLTVHRETRRASEPAGPSFNVLLPNVQGLPGVPVVHRLSGSRDDDIVDL
ncbi:MAG: hypothetical protein KKA73_05620 [Chloroflexi bacterium]|nr:hypothetical protein [Chloroflexota bacterium]MBU1747146.1 hypothetical protein [Chloroflexota bacterium]MBU1880300.1 hypothetical protein [Chloroflexota bacterium]